MLTEYETDERLGRAVRRRSLSQQTACGLNLAAYRVVVEDLRRTLNNPDNDLNW